MTKNPNYKRVLIKIPAGGRDYRLISLGVTLASVFRASLSVEFAYASELEEAAELPFTKSVQELSGEIVPINAERMARASSQQAKLYRRELTRLAGSNDIEYSFSFAKRSETASELSMTEEILAISGDFNTSRSEDQTSLLRNALAQNQCVLVAPPTRNFNSEAGICALVENLSEDALVLETAALLATKLNQGLTVAVDISMYPGTQYLEANLRAKFPDLTSIKIVPIGYAGAERHEITLNKIRPSLVVLKASHVVRSPGSQFVDVTKLRFPIFAISEQNIS